MADRNEELRIEDEIHRSSNSADPFAAAVRATRMPMLITDPRQDDNPIVFVNDAFGRLTGYAREETLGRNCRFLQGPATNQKDVARIRDAVERRVPIEIDLLNYRKNGTTFWNRLLISPVFDGNELLYFFASQFDVTPERNRLSELATDREALEREVERRILDLTRSEERLRFTLQAAGLGAWTLDLSNNRLVTSALCKQNFGREPTEPFGLEDLHAALHPDDLDPWRRTLDEVVESHGELDIECRIVNADGEIRWVEMRGQANYDADGQAIGVAGISLDVTERKEAEDHRNLLIRELDHRVKNTLATVQSIFSQTLRSAKTLEEASEVVFGRMQALASTHDVLTRDGWAAVSLPDVVAGALKPFRDEASNRVRAGGPIVRLRSRAATALSLALHELATNAVKYGALSNDSGIVILNWEVTETEEGERLVMRWQESDGPAVTPPSHRGFGSRMIERALAADFGGEARIDYLRNGLVFTLDAPLTQITE